MSMTIEEKLAVNKFFVDEGNAHIEIPQPDVSNLLVANHTHYGITSAFWNAPASFMKSFAVIVS